MARTPGGHQLLEKAKELLASARTAKELRQAQAVMLPLEFNLSLEQTAAVMTTRRAGGLRKAPKRG